MEHIKRFSTIPPESQGQNLALAVLYVPYEEPGRGEGGLSSEKGTPLKVLRTLSCTPGPNSGIDCLICAIHGSGPPQGGASE